MQNECYWRAFISAIGRLLSDRQNANGCASSQTKERRPWHWHSVNIISTSSRHSHLQHYSSTALHTLQYFPNSIAHISYSSTPELDVTIRS